MSEIWTINSNIPRDDQVDAYSDPFVRRHLRNWINPTGVEVPSSPPCQAAKNYISNSRRDLNHVMRGHGLGYLRNFPESQHWIEPEFKFRAMKNNLWLWNTGRLTLSDVFTRGPIRPYDFEEEDEARFAAPSEGFERSKKELLRANTEVGQLEDQIERVDEEIRVIESMIKCRRQALRATSSKVSPRAASVISDVTHNSSIGIAEDAGSGRDRHGCRNDVLRAASQPPHPLVKGGWRSVSSPTPPGFPDFSGHNGNARPDIESITTLPEFRHWNDDKYHTCAAALHYAPRTVSAQPFSSTVIHELPACQQPTRSIHIDDRRGSTSDAHIHSTLHPERFQPTPELKTAHAQDGALKPAVPKFRDMPAFDVHRPPTFETGPSIHVQQPQAVQPAISDKGVDQWYEERWQSDGKKEMADHMRVILERLLYRERKQAERNAEAGPSTLHAHFSFSRAQICQAGG